MDNRQINMNSVSSPNEDYETDTYETIPEMVTIREASNRTGLSYDFLRKSCLSGKIVHIRVGTGKFLINFGWLVNWLGNARGE